MWSPRRVTETFAHLLLVRTDVLIGQPPTLGRDYFPRPLARRARWTAHTSYRRGFLAGRLVAHLRRDWHWPPADRESRRRDRHDCCGLHVYRIFRHDMVSNPCPDLARIVIYPRFVVNRR